METESKNIDASTTMETESKDIDASNTDNDIESQSVKKNVDDDGKSRTGTMWTASAHIITGIVGSGVLALTWSMAQLGWIGGIAIMVAFSFITYYTSCLLADCYRYPSSTGGKRNVTYMDTVNAYLGKTMLKLCGMFQLIILCGATVGYTITTSISMVAIQKANCFHNRGRGAHCKFSGNWFMIGLGILEIFVSQIPSFHKLAGLSVLAAIMSLAYSLIGFGLALAKVISGDGGATTLTGVEIGPSLTAAGKTWRVFRAIGNMAFAFSFSAILIEIQDTLKPVPPENKVMRKANGVGMLTATALYMSCACLGYAAFGNNAPGNMLTGFGFYEPYWLINLGNIAIVIHLVGAYQVLSQPVFSTVESWASSKWPMSKFVNGEYPLITCNSKSILKINLFRLTWRTAYVVAATVLSMALPFFNEVLSLLGAVAYWPMTVYFPVEMCIVQKKIKRFTIKWIWLELLNLFCLLVSIAAVIGAIEGLERGLSSVKPFQFKQ